MARRCFASKVALIEASLTRIELELAWLDSLFVVMDLQ